MRIVVVTVLTFFTSCTAWATSAAELVTMDCHYKASRWNRTETDYGKFSDHFFLTIDLDDGRGYREGWEPFFRNNPKSQTSFQKYVVSDTSFSFKIESTSTRAEIHESVNRYTGDYNYEFTYPDASGGLGAEGSCSQVSPAHSFQNRKF